MSPNRVFSALCALPACAALTMKVYDASPTPVQVVRDPVSNKWTFNVHLYILADAADPTSVVQGGAFWRWTGCQDWRPAPVPLYDEHQVDPVQANTTIRGYNIAWGEELSTTPKTGAGACEPVVGSDGQLPQSMPKSMDFRIWGVSPSPIDTRPVQVESSKPVEVLTLPVAEELCGEAGNKAACGLDVKLFKGVAFSAGVSDGAHVHLVINVSPPQPPQGPHYQLFADINMAAAGDDAKWVPTVAPSRFEHTYDVEPAAPGSTGKKVWSRYNLSWRLAPGQDAQAKALSFRVSAVSYNGPTGNLFINDLEVARVDTPKSTALVI